MIKTSASLASITKIILVLIIAMVTSQQEISSTWDLVSRDIPDFGSEQNPNIGCILFGDEICYLYCAFNIDVYYIEINTDGYCDENNSCFCSYAVDAYFPHNWSMKFDSDYTKWAIMGNIQLLQHVFKIFLVPFKTAKEIKKILRPILSPYQYHKIEIDDDTIAPTLFENGKVNKHWVQEYVSEKVQTIFESNDERRKFYTNYEQNFRNALENVRDEGTLYNIAFDLRSIQNEKLDSIWREHLAKNKLKQPTIDIGYPERLESHLYHAITNEIIKQRDTMEDPGIDETSNEEDEERPWWYFF